MRGVGACIMAGTVHGIGLGLASDEQSLIRDKRMSSLSGSRYTQTQKPAVGRSTAYHECIGSPGSPGMSNYTTPPTAGS